MGMPKCMLPGTKVKGGESPHLALQRLLDKEFANFSVHVVIDGLEVVSENRPSHDYGIETRYVRFIFNATLNTRFEPLVVTVWHGRGSVRLSRQSARGTNWLAGLSKSSTPEFHTALTDGEHQIFTCSH